MSTSFPAAIRGMSVAHDQAYVCTATAVVARLTATLPTYALTAAASAAVFVSPLPRTRSPVGEPRLPSTEGCGGERRDEADLQRDQPTRHLTLGNYLGAMRRWADVDQRRADALFCIVDLHALTMTHDPARVRRLTHQAATLLLAARLDPERCTVFVQSHLDEHARLSYLLECVATDGEMRRMIQYKEKAPREEAQGDSVRLSLLTYPVLMATDILVVRHR